MKRGKGRERYMRLSGKFKVGVMLYLSDGVA
jgi:hypothetical protein